MRDDLAMVRDPGRWPQWPYLPLKRRTTQLERKDLGVIMDDGESLTVYHVYLFTMPTTPEGWQAAPQTRYASHEAMLADGWMVD